MSMELTPSEKKRGLKKFVVAMPDGRKMVVAAHDAYEAKSVADSGGDYDKHQEQHFGDVVDGLKHTLANLAKGATWSGSDVYLSKKHPEYKRERDEWNRQHKLGAAGAEILGSFTGPGALAHGAMKATQKGLAAVAKNSPKMVNWLGKYLGMSVGGGVDEAIRGRNEVAAGNRHRGGANRDVAMAMGLAPLFGKIAEMVGGLGGGKWKSIKDFYGEGAINEAFNKNAPMIETNHFRTKAGIKRAGHDPDASEIVMTELSKANKGRDKWIQDKVNALTNDAPNIQDFLNTFKDRAKALYGTSDARMKGTQVDLENIPGMTPRWLKRFKNYEETARSNNPNLDKTKPGDWESVAEGLKHMNDAAERNVKHGYGWAGEGIHSQERLIKSAMGEMSPELAEANSLWETMKRAESAYEKGKKFTSMTNKEVNREYPHYSKPEKIAFNAGLKEMFEEAMTKANMGDYVGAMNGFRMVLNPKNLGRIQAKGDVPNLGEHVSELNRQVNKYNNLNIAQQWLAGERNAGNVAAAALRQTTRPKHAIARYWDKLNTMGNTVSDPDLVKMLFMKPDDLGKYVNKVKTSSRRHEAMGSLARNTVVASSPTIAKMLGLSD